LKVFSSSPCPFQTDQQDILSETVGISTEYTFQVCLYHDLQNSDND